MLRTGQGGMAAPEDVHEQVLQLGALGVALRPLEHDPIIGRQLLQFQHA